jgi:hypothetical protein
MSSESGLDRDSEFLIAEGYTGRGRPCQLCTRPILEAPTIAVVQDDEAVPDERDNHEQHGAYNGYGAWCRHCVIRNLADQCPTSLHCPTCRTLKFVEMRHRGEVFCLRNIDPTFEGRSLRSLGISAEWIEGRYCQHTKKDQCQCRDCYCDACMQRAPNPQVSNPVELWNAIRLLETQIAPEGKYSKSLSSLILSRYSYNQELAYIRGLEIEMARSLTMQEEYLVWAAVISFRVVPDGEDERMLEGTDPNQLPENRFLTLEERRAKIADRVVHHISGSERLQRYARSYTFEGSTLDAYEIPLTDMDDDLMNAIYAIENTEFRQLFGDRLGFLPHQADPDTLYFVNGTFPEEPQTDQPGPPPPPTRCAWGLIGGSYVGLL